MMFGRREASMFVCTSLLLILSTKSDISELLERLLSRNYDSDVDCYLQSETRSYDN